jgi:hypothetical protein
MKLETINGIRVITPEAGMWLCNEKNRVISEDNKVYLGINADENDWHDIAEEEKANFEALWNAETPIDEEIAETLNYEKIIDILTGNEEA